MTRFLVAIHSGAAAGCLPQMALLLKLSGLPVLFLPGTSNAHATRQPLKVTEFATRASELWWEERMEISMTWPGPRPTHSSGWGLL